MESIGVLLTCPMSNHLQEQLSKRFTLFKFWQIPPNSKLEFFNQNSKSILAVVGNGIHGANSELINSLPNLEIIANHGSGLDKIDLPKCKQKGIRVTYTPDVVTEEVADLAILLTLATLRRICAADRFVRSGLWKNGDFELTHKVCFVFVVFSNRKLMQYNLSNFLAVEWQINWYNRFGEDWICNCQES